MITPEYLNKVIEGTSEKVNDLQRKLIHKICADINGTFMHDGEVTFLPTTLKELHQVVETGVPIEELQQIIEKNLPSIQKEIHKAFLQSASEISKMNTEVAKQIARIEEIDVKIPDYSTQGIPRSAKDLNLTPQEIRQLESAYKRTNTQVRNLTKTTAINARKIYIDECDKAFMKVKGGMSMSEAITQAIDNVAQTGLKTIDYKSGRSDSIEVAIARSVRTGINMANADIVLTRCAEMGVRYVRVSAHLGARVTKKLDYTNHSHWQGKVYSLNWDDPALSKYNFVEPEELEKSGFGWLNKIRDFLTRKKR